jgi:hypothetical protein
MKIVGCRCILLFVIGGGHNLVSIQVHYNQCDDKLMFYNVILMSCHYVMQLEFFTTFKATHMDAPIMLNTFHSLKPWWV